MDKEALAYGFKSYANREQAIPAIAEAKSGDLDAQMALSELERPDYNYGYIQARKALNKLDSKYGLSDILKKSPGYIESQQGYIKNKPDIYTTPQGAISASQFIRDVIISDLDETKSKDAEAIRKELEIRDKINHDIKKFNVKRESVARDIASKKLDYAASREQTLIPKMRGNMSYLISKFQEGKSSLDTSAHRKKLDKYNRKISDIPDDVAYLRFADALSDAASDSELINFRYY